MILFAVIATDVKSKTYILVAGAWHGKFAWVKVVPMLEARGHHAIAIDLPGQGDSSFPPASVTFTNYVDHVVRISNEQQGPVILVGHSMAGVVIAQAAEVLGNNKVSALIFLDAFMPNNGESVQSIAEKVGKSINKKSAGPSVMESLIFSEDQKTAMLKLENVDQLFYHDCSLADRSFAKENLVPQPMSCLVTPVQVSDERYGNIPKYYILCTEARDLDKTLISQNVPCRKIVKLKSSHSAFFSMPKRLTRIMQRV